MISYEKGGNPYLVNYILVKLETKYIILHINL